MTTLGNNFSVAKITYEWQCAKCGDSHAETYQMERGSCLYFAVIPDGWAAIVPDGRYPHEVLFYCPKHIVRTVTTVDGVVYAEGTVCVEG